MRKHRIPEVLKKMNEIFRKNGFKAYLVGGAVRDMIMGKEAHDWDIATDATPSEVSSIFRKVIPTGIAHGTVTVLFMKHDIEVTTFRTERGYSDGRHPDNVFFTKDLKEDLSRRDFTMNAIALSLEDGREVDYFGGKKDIRKKTIRTVGNPLERFTEDGLRPVRAIRFASKLKFKIEPETLNAISQEKVLDKIKSISKERFRDEFLKILSSDEPSEALKTMEKTGILDIFIPELAECRGCVQGDGRGFHDFDVLDHLFYSCDGSPKEKPNVRLASLFHDIGKPETKRETEKDGIKNITFYSHEKKSAEITRNILFRLKFSNAQIENVCHLVENHMFHYEPDWSDSAVRRFVVRVGYENIEDLFDLRISDVYGMKRTKIDSRNSETAKNLLELKERIEKVREEKSALSLKDLAVNGKTLMSLGIPPGKELGFVLKSLLDTVLDDPSQNTEEKLSEIAVKTWRKHNGFKADEN